jgi:hypothetical protein
MLVKDERYQKETARERERERERERGREVCMLIAKVLKQK